MQLDVTKLTPEAHRAIVECLIIAARRGRLLREAREREQAALQAGLPQNGAVDATANPSSPGNPSQQANDSQQSRCDSHSD
jgi:hypothetical protein